jgi:hypothetical protein
VSPAEKQRAYRKRRDAGRAVIRIEVDVVSCGAALLAAGLIDDADDLDQIGRALSALTIERFRTG